MAARHETLTRVSWSNLRIHAFPGIYWSRSPLDAMRYARQRFIPDRTAIAELDVKVAAQPGAIPGSLVCAGTRSTHPALDDLAAAARADHRLTARRHRRGREPAVRLAGHGERLCHWP